MDQFLDDVWNSLFVSKYSPYIIIAIVFFMFLIIKNGLKKWSTELFVKILALIIGVVIFYCIIWYLDQIKIEM